MISALSKYSDLLGILPLCSWFACLPSQNNTKHSMVIFVHLVSFSGCFSKSIQFFLNLLAQLFNSPQRILTFSLCPMSQISYLKPLCDNYYFQHCPHGFLSLSLFFSLLSQLLHASSIGLRILYFCSFLTSGLDHSKKKMDGGSGTPYSPQRKTKRGLQEMFCFYTDCFTFSFSLNHASGASLGSNVYQSLQPHTDSVATHLLFLLVNAQKFVL